MKKQLEILFSQVESKPALPKEEEKVQES